MRSKPYMPEERGPKVMTLDGFFKLPIKRRTVFYLDWDSEPFEAQWLTTLPTKVNYEATVQWRDLGYPITVCGNIPQDAKPFVPFSQDCSCKNVSLLKSHLQKCVRRQLTDKAMATAWQLANLSLQDLVRRIPVIMIEDVRLNSTFPALIWLMSATSKGYQPSHDQIAWLLGIVKDLSQDPKAEDLPMRGPINSYNIPVMVKALENDKQLTEDQRSVLYSLLFRIAYGGMGGDLNMIWNLAQVWFQRFKANEALPIKATSPVSLEDESRFDLSLSSLEIASADFHVFPKLIDQLKAKFPQYEPQDLKLCIWECSSKTNLRKLGPVDPKWMAIWAVIEAETRSLQTPLIRSQR